MSDKILKLSQAQTLYQDLRQRIDALPTDSDIPEVPVQDVQVNGTSVVTNGVANVPIAGTNIYGVVKSTTTNGVQVWSHDGSLMIVKASDAIIKAGANNYYPITASGEHTATFYGLAKAAGHDEKDSTESFGTYTDGAKQAIQNMLGITDLLSTEESSTATAAHAANSTFMMDGKLHRATAAIAIGDAVEVGTNCEVVKADEVFVKNTDIASSSNVGVVKIGNGLEIQAATQKLQLLIASDQQIKLGAQLYGYAIVPAKQHIATFYGLSKIAGVDLANETVTLGTYPATSKTAIQNMLGVPSITDLNIYATKADTILTTTLSCGRKANTTIGQYSFAFGIDVEASGSESSHAEGLATAAKGSSAHAEGNGSTASGYASHAENTATASGLFSHAENGGIASGGFSHAENSATASGMMSHADGSGTASGVMSHASGQSTIANSLAQFVFGSANIADTGTSNTGARGTYVEIIGNGQDNDTRSNAYALEWTGTAHYAGDVYVNCNNDSSGGTMLPKDIQVNGVSVVSNGVANIPVADSTTYGVAKITNATYGLSISPNGQLMTSPASDANVKAGTEAYRPLAPYRQHMAVFYGLAKAAGDTTQSASSNAVGTYTTEAKAAIHTMLGIDPASIAAQVDIPLVETVSGTTPTITGQPNVRYVCGEVSTISITPPASGSVDVIFESGSTATTMTVPSTVKWPAWFDAEALEANTTYEVLITDGIYGSVMTWAT